MFKSNIWTAQIPKKVSLRSFTVLLIALLSGGIGILLSSTISKMLPVVYTFVGRVGIFDTTFWGLIIGILIMVLIILLRLIELAATLAVAASIILDWYLHINYVALLMALILLLIFYLGRGSRYPWVKPPALFLWVLFLVLIIFSGIRGSLTTYEALYYYPYITLGAFVMYWLGTIIARDTISTRHLLKLLTGFGTLIAIHAIIQEITGKFLFGSSINDSYYASLNNFILLTGLSVHRVGSFLLNPDWAGPFFAVMLFVTIGLFLGSESLIGKIFYLIEVSLIGAALLFTYTYGAMIGFGIGTLVLMILVGHNRYRIQLSLMIFLSAIVIIVFFSGQIGLLQSRYVPADSLIRVGAWQTAIRIIQAYPLTGIGLGLYNYLARAEPFRVAAQYQPLAHPLNSYLEFGSVGGLPVLLVFIALQVFAFWLAIQNWTRSDTQTRALIAGCIAAITALSIDSLTNNVWTIPPLATLGWIVFGVISSPILRKSQSYDDKQTESIASVTPLSDERNLYV